MNRFQLGRTGIEVTELCMGTLILGRLQADLPPETGALAVRRALEKGINFLDTAKGYATYEHTRLGMEGFNSHNIVISSKSPVKTAEKMRADVETCLRELGRDMVDIFHLHFVKSPEDLKDRAGAIETLVRCREEGKIRAIGLSAHGYSGTACALECDDIDVVLPIVNKKGLGLIDGSLDDMLGLVKRIRDSGRGLYDMKPLGGGHLIDDIPGAIGYVRDSGLFDSVAVGLKTAEEVEIMAGVFENDPHEIERARRMGVERAGKKKLKVYDFACIKCGACVEACGQSAMSIGEMSAQVDESLCILCGYCASSCPKFAIRVI